MVAAGFVLTLAFIANADRAQAFWPFSSPAAAQSLSFGPDSSVAALHAATNSDPNPYKNPVALATTGGSALIADSGPSGTLADVASSTPSDHISLYVVRAGDRLSDISKMFGVSVNTIVWANSLGSTRDIHPGQQLVILPVSGVEHKVAKGETLASIAKKFGGDANEIAEFNGLDSGAALTVGATIIVPGGELAAPPTSSTHKVAANPFRGDSGPAYSGYYVNPVPGALLTQRLHGWNGVDLGAARGTPIHAAAAGLVIVAKNNGGWNGGYGNYVVLTHDNGTQTLYAHATSVIVSIGQSVGQGQVIGYVGRTGEATGPHLHFEVRGAKNPFSTCPLRAVCEPQ